VAHAARLLNIWRETGINPDQVMVTINRSGAKYKEGVTTKDFERVCHKPIQFFLPNDIRSVVNSENQGKTILELGKSRLAEDIQEIAHALRGFKEEQTA
jgi:Flp pilus assembly CpaE family ATPase